jgi:hypothetical protein
MLLVLLDLAFVARYGADLPMWDDFDVVPVAVGEDSLTGRWLWQPHNEHRMPLPKLVLLGAYRLTGNDFRAGMVFNVVALAAAAAALTAAAHYCRGRAACSDALFPLALLNWGHHATLLLSWQAQFALSTLLACGALAMIVRTTRDLGTRRIAVTVILLALLLLCGMNGVALVPALLCWVAAGTGIHYVRTILFAAAAAALGLVAVGGIPEGGPQLAGHDWSAVVKTAVQFSSMAFGPAAKAVSTYSAIAIVVLIAATAALLLTALRQPAERTRATGVLCFLAAMMSLALAVGWGRAGSITFAGFADRYVTLAVPVLCAVSFGWQLYGGAVWRRVVPTALFVVLCAAAVANSRIGLEHGRKNRATAAAFRADMLAGVPRYRLVRRYTPFLCPWQETLDTGLVLLRSHGVGDFAALADNPRFEEMSLAVDSGSAWPSSGISLPVAREIAGVRVRYSLANLRGTAPHLWVWWSHDGNRFDPALRAANALTTAGRDRSSTFWIDDVVKQLRFEPEPAADMRIANVALLVPAESPVSKP